LALSYLVKSKREKKVFTTLNADRWKRDPLLACQDAGIPMPMTVPSPCGVAAQPTTPKQKMLYSENSFLVDEQLGEDELLCESCCDLVSML
jgi:hypothetical protein